MTDPPENNWTPHPADCDCHWCDDGVTHRELVAESGRVITVLMAKMSDQMAHLNKTHTVALMAAELYGKCTEAEPEFVAKMLFRNVEKTLEIDRQITGHIA